MKVLLVEDDSAIREGMTELVSELADARPASSVSEALGLMERELYDLVVTDLRIGGDRDGGRKIVAAARTFLVPVAIISASAEEEIRRTMGNQQPDAILMKPFQLDDLLGLTDQFLARRRTVDLRAGSRESLEGIAFEPLDRGLSASWIGRADGGHLRWLKLDRGARVALSTPSEELWVVVEGTLQTEAVTRPQGTAVHLAQGLNVNLTAPDGALVLSLVTGR